LLILAAVLVTILLLQIEEDISMREYLEDVYWILVAGTVFMAFSISLPFLRYSYREIRNRGREDERGFKNYLVYFLTKALMLPAVTILLIQAVVPGAFIAHDWMYEKYIYPRYTERLDGLRLSVADSEFDDEEMQAELLDIIDHELGAQHCLDSFSYEDLGLPVILNVVFWIVITTYVMLFVIPYLAMGGWGKGLFYMVILGMSFLTENVLEKAAPEWFGLESGSVPSILIIAFFIFANALFFDWMYELGAEKTRVCPGCHAHLEDADRYCSRCGFVQM
jgi:hypothetical protein